MRLSYPRLFSAAATGLLAAISIPLAWIGCGGATDETTLARIQRESVLRVGYANEAPYAYMDSAQKRLTGEAPEIARVLADYPHADEVMAALRQGHDLLGGEKVKRLSQSDD